MLKQIFNNIKGFIILCYNKFIDFVKKVFNKNTEINKQTTNQDIHIVKVRVKKIGNKKIEN